MKPTSLLPLYEHLKKTLGPQDWWPVNHRARVDRFETLVPVDPAYRWEIMVGAVLTQNTSWSNVEKALEHLRTTGASRPGTIPEPGWVMDISQDSLAQIIRPAGYFNQKAKKLRILAEAVQSKGWLSLEEGYIPKRDEVIGLWGIGGETADCIMVYALGVPHFIIDQYKRRIFTRLAQFASDILPNSSSSGALNQAETLEYEELAGAIEGLLPRDVGIYNDFHAQLVRLGAVACGKRPVCAKCPIGPFGSGLCRGIPSGKQA